METCEKSESELCECEDVVCMSLLGCVRHTVSVADKKRAPRIQDVIGDKEKWRSRD